MEHEIFVYTALVLLAFVIALIAILRSARPFSFEKHLEGGSTCLTIHAKKDLAKVTVVAISNGDEVDFERKRVRNGQSIDFVYPQSGKPARLIVEAARGKTYTIDV